MNIIYIFLTILMFLDCVVLIFLVLLQLPKKEAGAGMAFGGAATDALFGAGSGNMLTNITKYAAGIFFGLAILMAFLASQKPKSSAASLAEKLIQNTAAPMPSSAPAATPPASPPSSSGFLQLTNAPQAAPAPAPSVNTNK
jgi:preprotein translocase subunit SecG